MRWSERWFWFWTGVLVSGLFHLVATTTPAQAASNARDWLAFISR